MSIFNNDIVCQPFVIAHSSPLAIYKGRLMENKAISSRSEDQLCESINTSMNERSKNEIINEKW